MILRKFMQHVREQNWFAVGLDIIVVIVGIFLGLQVQEWNESREEAITIEVFAQSMIDDLEADIETLEYSISFTENKLSTIDHFQIMLGQSIESWDVDDFYDYMSIVFSIAPFNSTDGTYQQLKASGSLQYFDQQLVNKMNAYDNQIKKTMLRDAIMINTETEFLSVNEPLVNFEVMATKRAGKLSSKEKYIRFKDEFAIDLFINRIIRKQQVMLRSYEEYQAQLIFAQDLLADLKRTYPSKLQ